MELEKFVGNNDSPRPSKALVFVERLFFKEELASPFGHAEEKRRGNPSGPLGSVEVFNVASFRNVVQSVHWNKPSCPFVEIGVVFEGNLF